MVLLCIDSLLILSLSPGAVLHHPSPPVEEFSSWNLKVLQALFLFLTNISKDHGLP